MAYQHLLALFSKPQGRRPWKPPEFAVLSVILFHFNEDRGFAWPALQTIGDVIGATPRQVINIIARLQKRGLITKVQGRGRGHSNRYTPTQLTFRELMSSARDGITNGAEINSVNSAPFTRLKGADSGQEKVRKVTMEVRTEDVLGSTHTQPRGVTASGAMGGALPREHLKHAWCGNFRKCVPDFLHGEFVRALGGEPDAARRALAAFYERTMEAITDDEPIAAESTKFWRPRFAAEFRSPPVRETTPAQRRMLGPTYAPWICDHVDQCGHRAMCNIKITMGVDKYPVKQQAERQAAPA